MEQTTDIKEIKNLLQQVILVRQKYEDIAEITGENFNLFEILNLKSDELTHSKFISYLLNAKGKHGQKDLFLKLFIDQIKNRFENDKNQVLIHFDKKNSRSITEKSIGNKSEDVSEGGRIDIIINDGKNNIIIENKIYAGDQEKQMIRYHNHDPNAPLIYLSLGDENPSEDSINHSDNFLELNKDFISISYKSEIKMWIKECIKAVYDKPLIRETLRQYEFLINELTNQSNNSIMSEEIIKIILSDEANFSALEVLNKVSTKIKINVIQNKINPILIELAEKYKLELINNLFNEKWKNFGFTYENLKINNLKISFAFSNSSEYVGFIYGLNFIDKSAITYNQTHQEIFKELQNTFQFPKKEFNSKKNYTNWLHVFNYTGFENWNNLETLKKINFGDFKSDLTEKLEQIIFILNKYGINDNIQH